MPNIVPFSGHARFCTPLAQKRRLIEGVPVSSASSRMAGCIHGRLAAPSPQAKVPWMGPEASPVCKMVAFKAKLDIAHEMSPNDPMGQAASVCRANQSAGLRLTLARQASLVRNVWEGRGNVGMGV